MKRFGESHLSLYISHDYSQVLQGDCIEGFLGALRLSLKSSGLGD
jgi:hypothetical protein